MGEVFIEPEYARLAGMFEKEREAIEKGRDAEGRLVFFLTEKQIDELAFVETQEKFTKLRDTYGLPESGEVVVFDPQRREQSKPVILGIFKDGIDILK